MPLAEPLSAAVSVLFFWPEPCVSSGSARGPKRREAGPKARLSALRRWSWDYQLPLEGQPPSPVVVQVRIGAPPPVFWMVKSLPDFEWPTIV